MNEASYTVRKCKGFLLAIEKDLADLDEALDIGELTHEQYFPIVELYTAGVILRAKVQAILYSLEEGK